MKWSKTSAKRWKVSVDCSPQNCYLLYMKTFLIAYKYTMCGSVEVKAESLEEAKKISVVECGNNARNDFYVANSFTPDDELSHEVKEESSELVWSSRYNIRFDIINSPLREVRLASEHKPHSPIQTQRVPPQTQHIRFREQCSGGYSPSPLWLRGGTLHKITLAI